MKRSRFWWWTVLALGIVLTMWNLGWLMPAVWHDAPGWRGWIARRWYGCLRLFCHQIPERSFHLRGHPLGVCHRCSGIYTGMWLGWGIGVFWPWPRRRLRIALWVTAVAWSVMGAEWALGVWKTWDHATTRVLTGGLAGMSTVHLWISLWTMILGEAMKRDAENE